MKTLLSYVGLALLSGFAVGSSKDERPLDGGPNPLYGRFFPAEGKIGLSEKMDASGTLRDVVWIRDPKVFQKALGEVAAQQRLTLTVEINWAVPLYVVFVDSQDRIVFAGKSDQGRCFLYPAKAALKGTSVRIESVENGKRKGRLPQGDAREHNLYAGILSADVIKRFEAVLAKAAKPK